MNEVTRILSGLATGDTQAAAQLLPLVYDELRRLAAARLADEPSGNTLQPTALVHEAYLRLVGSPNGVHWNHRGHFFAAAAEAIRRILVEHAGGSNDSNMAANGNGFLWKSLRRWCRLRPRI